MTHDKTGGPAFPTDFEMSDGTFWRQQSMTLRDYFAGQALAKSGFGLFSWTQKHNAQAAYQQADAMLREREDTNND